MRRVDIIEACNSIARVLEKTNIRAHITNTLRPPGGGELDPAPLLSALREYSIEESKWGTSEHKIAAILGLEPLANTKFWGSILNAATKKSGSDLVYEVRSSITFAMQYLPKLIALLEHTPAATAIKTGRKQPESEVLTIILIEDDEQRSTPERLVMVLTGTKDLYEACAAMLDLPQHGMSVISCDSGSDKSFDFLGAAKVIQALKELILSMWDRVVFYREQKLESRLDLVGQALPIVGKIDKLKETGAMDPAEAELLKRKILGGIHKLLETGVVIPEINERARYNPRQLMAPEPKLLTAGTPPPVEVKANGQDDYVEDDEAAAIDVELVDGEQQAVPPVSFDINALSEADQQALNVLLRKGQASSAKRKPVAAAPAKKSAAAKKSKAKASTPPPPPGGPGQ